MKTLILALLVPAAAQATMTPSYPRGEQLVQILSPNAVPETCVIPTHLPLVDYSKKDLDREQGLCKLQQGLNVAVCPKMASTNPGIEWFQVPTGYSITQAEQSACFIANPQDKKDNVLKKLAKYKNSTSCSYTPSILGYYHVSRILGGIGRVPPAVLRTFDIQRHKEIAQKGIDEATRRYGAAAVIVTTWRSLLGAMNAGAGSSKKDALFTDAIDQTYGALQENPRDEEKYSALFNAAKGTETRAMAFRDRNPTFQLVRSSRPLSSLVSSSFTAANVQTVQAMKDVADLSIIDTLMSQEDRFGNIHDEVRYAYLETKKDGTTEVKFDSKLKPEEIAAKKAVQVKQMLLKDNDCGVSRMNRAKEAGLVQLLAHVDPKTYQAVLWFDSIVDQPDVTKSFKSGMMMTANDFATMRTLLKSIATTLKSRCQSGAMQLDLDIDRVFSGQAPVANQCELVAPQPKVQPTIDAQPVVGDVQ